MSYKQAMKYSSNFHKGKRSQPIILGIFTNHSCEHSFPVPHFAKQGDLEPDYYMCIRCGARNLPRLTEKKD